MCERRVEVYERAKALLDAGELEESHRLLSEFIEGQKCRVERSEKGLLDGEGVE